MLATRPLAAGSMEAKTSCVAVKVSPHGKRVSKGLGPTQVACGMPDGPAIIDHGHMVH